MTAAAGLVGAASVPQLVKFKGCVCSRYGKVPPSPPPPPELRKCCVLGPPTHRPVRGAARLVGEPFLLCVIGRSTSDVLGGPRKLADGRVQAASGPRVSPAQAAATSLHPQFERLVSPVA